MLDLKYTLLFLFAVFLASCSQIMLKNSADRAYDNPVREYLNPLVLTAYVLFFGSSLLVVLAYRIIPLSLGPILESAGYVFVAVLSRIFLKERIGGRKLVGIFLILCGIAISGL